MFTANIVCILAKPKQVVIRSLVYAPEMATKGLATSEKQNLPAKRRDEWQPKYLPSSFVATSKLFALVIPIESTKEVNRWQNLLLQPP